MTAEINLGNTAVGEHLRFHKLDNSRFYDHFKILRKCRSKWDCLLYEMLFIREMKPSLNKQKDSISSKLF